MDSILDIPAEAVSGVEGTTDTAVLVRFPSGNTIAVGVQVGKTAREYLGVDWGEGAKVVGVRQRGEVHPLG